MNATTEYEHVPLDEGDKELLREVYQKRLKGAIMAHLVVTPILLLNKLPIYLTFILILVLGVGNWFTPGDLQHISWFQLWLPGALLIIVLLCFTFYLTINNSLALYKKDLENGFKYKVPYTVTSKKYFEVSNQFFFGLDDPKYPNHEVDEEFYNQCERGDTIYLYRAPLSGGTFQMNGTFNK